MPTSEAQIKSLKDFLDTVESINRLRKSLLLNRRNYQQHWIMGRHDDDAIVYWCSSLKAIEAGEAELHEMDNVFDANYDEYVTKRAALIAYMSEHPILMLVLEKPELVEIENVINKAMPEHVKNTRNLHALPIPTAQYQLYSTVQKIKSTAADANLTLNDVRAKCTEASREDVLRYLSDDYRHNRNKY